MKAMGMRNYLQLTPEELGNRAQRKVRACQRSVSYWFERQHPS